MAMAFQGPVFAPPHRDEFYRIIAERYIAARTEADAIGRAKRIKMRVEFLKPVHLNLTDYTLPVGDTEITMADDCALFPYGILNLDSSFDYMKWWTGAKVQYIGDWFVLPVYYFLEKQGAYKGNLSTYEFRAGETFTFNVHSTTSPTPAKVNAWLLAFAVLPATKAETKIIK
jgi:hypothetical protein